MDPDVCLATCLDDTLPTADRNEAALALRGWLLRGGFPPGAWIVEQAGVTKRRKLQPTGRCRLFLQKQGPYWVIVYTGDLYNAPYVWRLRAKHPGKEKE